LCAESVIKEACELFSRLIDAPKCSSDRAETLNVMPVDVAARVESVLWASS
jgi:hypothetical protein